MEFDEAIVPESDDAKRYESPAYPHLNLGRVYERKGNWTEAIDSYKKALTLDLKLYARQEGTWATGELIELKSYSCTKLSSSPLPTFFYTKVRDALRQPEYQLEKARAQQDILDKAVSTSPGAIIFNMNDLTLDAFQALNG